MFNAESDVDERISPKTIALIVLVKLYVKNTLPSCRCLLFLLSSEIEGSAKIKNKHLVIDSTLLSLCHAIDEAYKSVPSKGSMHNFSTEWSNRTQLCLLEELWNINSADHIQRIVNDAYSLLTDTISITKDNTFFVSSRSLIGRFVQKTAVSIKLLHFEESSFLYKTLSHYRSSSSELLKTLKGSTVGNPVLTCEEYPCKNDGLFDTWNVVAKTDFRRNGKAIKNNEKVLHVLTSRMNDMGFDSSDISDSFTEFQITSPYLDSLIDTQVMLLEKYGTTTPRFIRQVLEEMAYSETTINSLSGLRQKNHISSAQYLAYLENLHSGDYHGAFNCLHKYFDYMVSKGSNFFYHFALISKAALHQYFGEDGKALDSIEEAISVARENKDNTTLTYILSWVYDFMRKKPNFWLSQPLNCSNNDSRLLDCLIRKSSSVSLSLSAVSFRFQADHLMNSNGTFTKYYESLFKALYVSINDSVSSFLGVCHTSSDLWERVGFPHLAKLAVEIGEHYSAKNGTTDDLLAFQLRKSFFAPPTEQCTEVINDFSYGSRIAQYKVLQSHDVLIKAHKMLKRGRIHSAIEILDTFPDNESLDGTFLMEKCRVRSLIHLRLGNFSEALRCLSLKSISSFRLLSVKTDLKQLIKTNLARCRVLIRSGVSLRVFSLIMQQLELTKMLGIGCLIAEATILLVELLNHNGHHTEAYNLGISMLSLVLCSGNNHLISSAFYELARSCSSFFDTQKKKSKFNNKEIFNQSLNYLSLSMNGFRKEGDLHMIERCFELEQDISSKTLAQSGLTNLEYVNEFLSHSRKGLEVLHKRSSEEVNYDFLTKFKR